MDGGPRMRDFDRQSLRERIEGLSFEEALAVALDAYDALRGGMRQAVAEVCQATYLQPAPAVVFLALVEARGRIVTFDHLSARSREVFGDYPSNGSHRTAVKRIRAAIRERGWPITIRAHWRVGYVLNTPPGWVAPWEMQP